MDFNRRVDDLLKKVEEYENGNKNNCTELPSKCVYLSKDEILCYPKYFGDCRYPYFYDGRNLWAYSSGNIIIEESAFSIISNALEGAEPYLAFFVGEKQNNGFFPISITGVAKQPFEKDVKRFVIYSLEAVYYFAQSRNILSCCRMFVDNLKNIKFSIYIKNISTEKIDTYISSYFNPTISYGGGDYMSKRWLKKCQTTDNGFNVTVTEYVNRTICYKHNAVIKRSSLNNKIYSTTSHAEYAGGFNNQIYCSYPLQNGKFEQCISYTEFSDMPIAGDIIPIALKNNESFCVSYTLATSDDINVALKNCNDIETEQIDKVLYNDNSEFFKDIPLISLSKCENKNINDSVFGNFISSVFKQVEFCARSKNYAGTMIGIRDIFQQVEASLMWIPTYSRSKIIEALNFIGDDGRAPRQYSYPANSQSLPMMDLRPYIDQGVWIISTVYTYLTFTDDFSILDEICGYYKLSNKVDFSDRKDSVLDHLIAICDYLIRNIDDKTNCLHALYGDWNDALDGLGKTNDVGKEYGTGVSVMATLQLFKNLNELCDILNKINKYPDKVQEYSNVAERLKNGLQENAIVERNGEKKILHGWGDKNSYKVGSFCDGDEVERDGITSNAFWIIAGAYNWDSSIKETILNAYKKLDSKYGLKTFAPAFREDDKGVGRIGRMPIGTAENGAVYIHATLFAIWSLFMIDEPEKAWKQIFKILPITHDFISTTPFVMPNSYISNMEKGFDGESMSDWYTGSGCVLVKQIIWFVFGVRTTLNGINICPARYIPFKNGKMEIIVKGKKIIIDYKNNGNVVRSYKINGNSVDKVYIDGKDKGEFIVEVID